MLQNLDLGKYNNKARILNTYKAQGDDNEAFTIWI